MNHRIRLVVARRILTAALAASGTISGCSDTTPESRYIEEDGTARTSVSPSRADLPPAPAAAPAADATTAQPSGGTISFAGVTMKPDPSWRALAPSSAMRRAEFTAGDEAAPAEIVVFHFGSGQGGTVEQNLIRWARLVRDPQDEPTIPTLSEFEAGSLRITLASFTGTYLSGPPGGEQIPRPGYTLLAAVIEGAPEGSIFPRLVGPSATVAAERSRFESFLRSVALTR